MKKFTIGLIVMLGMLGSTTPAYANDCHAACKENARSACAHLSYDGILYYGCYDMKVRACKKKKCTALSVGIPGF